MLRDDFQRFLSEVRRTGSPLSAYYRRLATSILGLLVNLHAKSGPRHEQIWDPDLIVLSKRTSLNVYQPEIF
jgi:hypothetical protein